MSKNFAKIAFTDRAREMQGRFGSRQAYARMEESGDKYVLTPREISFIEARDHFYMATVGDNGWPYVQHRGGPRGFLRVLDETTLGFADYRGNRQYISVGNVMTNDKVSLILVDYANQQRLKLWALAEVFEPQQDPALAEALESPGYRAHVERFVVLKIEAFDWNCPQHIVPRFTCEEIASLDLDAVEAKRKQEKKGSGQDTSA